MIHKFLYLTLVLLTALQANARGSIPPRYPGGNGGGGSGGGGPVLRYEVAVSPYIGLSADNEATQALDIITLVGRNMAKLQETTGDASDFTIEITDSRQAFRGSLAFPGQVFSHDELSMSLALPGPLEISDNDVFTVMVNSGSDRRPLVLIMYDRIAYKRNEKGQYQRRQDTVPRLVAALGHAIFGSVRQLLQQPHIRDSVESLDRIPGQLLGLTYDAEAAAAGVEFMESLVQQLPFGVPEWLKNDYVQALARKRELLSYFQSALADVARFARASKRSTASTCSDVFGT